MQIRFYRESQYLDNILRKRQQQTNMIINVLQKMEQLQTYTNISEEIKRAHIVKKYEKCKKYMTFSNVLK